VSECIYACSAFSAALFINAMCLSITGTVIVSRVGFDQEISSLQLRFGSDFSRHSASRIVFESSFSHCSCTLTKGESRQRSLTRSRGLRRKRSAESSKEFAAEDGRVCVCIRAMRGCARRRNYLLVLGARPAGDSDIETVHGARTCTGGQLSARVVRLLLDKTNSRGKAASSRLFLRDRARSAAGVSQSGFDASAGRAIRS
jgi:hypothetical protein